MPPSKATTKYTQVKPVAQPAGTQIRSRLLKLAASDFDPDDYRHMAGSKSVNGYCVHCHCRHAPLTVCGYCRGRVKMIRDGREAEINWSGEGPVPVKPGPKIYVEPTLPKESDDDQGM